MEFSPFFIPITFFIVIAVIVKIVSDNRVKHKIVEKNMLNENVRYLFTDTLERHIPSSLKWGMVLIGVGLAFLIGRLVPYRISEEVTIGSMFLLAGLGLVAYYLIASHLVKKAKTEKLD